MNIKFFFQMRIHATHPILNKYSTKDRKKSRLLSVKIERDDTMYA